MTGAVVAAEALVRLRDGRGGIRMPDTFIPLAEQTGRIARIDRMVLARAVPLAVRWRALLDQRPFSIGVNLSVVGLSDASLVDFVRDTCDDAGLPYDALVLEVTETVLSVPGNGHEDVLCGLHELGCNVTMDDFGTGYSSLQHLARFPIDGIKIDRQFVANIGADGRGGLIPQALVRLGADLGLHVVAEGVETLEQLVALRQAGCPFAQGYLISRPLPPEQVPEFLETHGRALPVPRTEHSA